MNIRMFRLSPATILIEVRSTFDGQGKGGERYCIPSSNIAMFSEKIIKNSSCTHITLKTGETITTTCSYHDFLSAIIEVDDAS